MMEFGLKHVRTGFSVVAKVLQNAGMGEIRRKGPEPFPTFPGFSLTMKLV